MLPNACPKPRPAIFDKRDERREAEAVQRSVTAQVDARDGYACRCCGREKGRGLAMHRHHLVFRSKGGLWSTENIVLLCALCHALLHARQLWILGKNADKRLTFELHESAVVDLFGSKVLPRDVRIVVESRR